MSSAYFPHSNTRTEMGVKSSKRLLRMNTGHDGSITNGRFHRALLAHRNTPDPDTGVSPAQVLFGRPIRDLIPIVPGRFKPHEGWRLTQEERERALKVRYTRGQEAWSEHTRNLTPLQVGDRVLIQNQSGTPKIAKRWDRSGVVLEVGDHDQYHVKVDGSGRLSLRNRKFLRKGVPYQSRKPAPRHQLPDVGLGLQPQAHDMTVVPVEVAMPEVEVTRPVGEEGHRLVTKPVREMITPEVEALQHREEMNRLVEVDVARPDVEVSRPVVEMTRPVRIKKPKYNSEEWDLARD